jgi:hypothetical protein
MLVFAASVGDAWGSEGTFAIERFGTPLSEQSGEAATQAGSHPYALTTTLVFSHNVLEEREIDAPLSTEVVPYLVESYGEPKNIEVNLPQGVVVDPEATETRCTEAELERQCPAASAAGYLLAFANEFPPRERVALYNMVPPTGVPAEFGANLQGLGIIVHLEGKVRSASDYGLTGSATNILKTHQIYSVQATLWGSPTDPSHDSLRGTCAELFPPEVGDCPVEREETPLLTMPSSCTSQPLISSTNVQSWREQELSAQSSASATKGCGALQFDPAVKLQPETTAPASATGLSFGLEMPQSETFGNDAEANLRDAVVTLPAGITFNPSTANGREVCSRAQIGLQPPSTERQALVVNPPLAREFFLELGGARTPLLSADASAAEVKTALEALPGIGAGNVEVASLEDGWQVTFAGVLAHGDTPVLGGVISNNAQQEIALTATGGSFALALGGHTTSRLPYYTNDTEMERQLEALPGIGPGKVTVTGGPEKKHEGGDSDVYHVVLDDGTEIPTIVASSGTASATGDLTDGSHELTAVNTDLGIFHVGDTLIGNGIPSDATITEINGTTLTLSVPAFLTQAGVELTANPSLTGPGASVNVIARTLGSVPLPATITEHGGGVRFNAEHAHCPAASEIGEVEVGTPLLSHPLPGLVYLASQDENPFGSLFAIYIGIDDPTTGIMVKLAGHVEANPETGQITTTFRENPELPVEDIKLKLWGGERAPLVTPTPCGIYHTSTRLNPWSSPEGTEGAAATPSSFFRVGPEGGSCAPPGFEPSFTAGTTNNQAGAYGPLVLSLSRSDSEQKLRTLEATLAPGLLAKLAGVPQCSNADAAAGTCSEESEIGTATVAAGVGSDPVYVHGKIYLTGPYNNGPFGEVTVVPAVAGPFNLGNVIVRGSLRVNETTAQASIVSDPFPEFVENTGVPADVQRVEVTIGRPGFMVNPTNCSALAVSGTVTSTAGTSAQVSSPFEAANCATLPFKPSLSASTGGRASKADGAGLHIRFLAKGGPQPGGGEANTKSVKVDLPKQLPSRLSTLQRACLAVVFEANPAACPPESDVGAWTATTPLLAQPLTGPAYLVSHGAAKFPDVEIIFQGEGVKVIVDGITDVKHGITSFDMQATPDVPLSTVEATFPTGPYSVLGTNIPERLHYNLCGQNLEMPTAITGQNGAVIKETIKIAVTGCPKHKAGEKKKKKKTRKK